MKFKQFCLSIYFINPNSYKVMRNELILSPRILQQLIEILQISPRLNDIFDTMKKEFSISHYWTRYV